MGPPSHKSLQRGAHVDIVLKVDQRTGKLTSGHIADILTRADHPRGVKVRLQDGSVGRVQSLGSGTSRSLPSLPSSREAHDFIGRPSVSNDTLRGPSSSRHLQDLDDGAASQPTSLADYIKPAKSRTKPAPTSPSMAGQEQLEATFPELDSALIAAILVDYPDMEDAKGILSTLCAD